MNLNNRLEKITQVLKQQNFTDVSTMTLEEIDKAILELEKKKLEGNSEYRKKYFEDLSDALIEDIKDRPEWYLEQLESISGGKEE